MLEIGVAEAKAQIATLLDRVLDGEQVIITNEGDEVARIMPTLRRTCSAASDWTPEQQAQAEAAAQRIRARAAKMKVGFDWEKFKNMRDEGRR